MALAQEGTKYRLRPHKFYADNMNDRPYSISLFINDDRISNKATLRQPGIFQQGFGNIELKYPQKRKALKDAVLVYEYDTSAFKQEMVQVTREVQFQALPSGNVLRRTIQQFHSNKDLVNELAFIDSAITASNRADLAMVSVLARLLQEEAANRELTHGELSCASWALSQIAHVVRMGLPAAHVQRMARMLNDLFTRQAVRIPIGPGIGSYKVNKWFLEVGYVPTFSYQLRQKDGVDEMRYVEDENIPVMGRLAYRLSRNSRTEGYLSAGFAQTPLRWFYQGHDTVTTARRGLAARSFDVSIGACIENPNKFFRFFPWFEFGVQVHTLREYDFEIYAKELIPLGPPPSFRLHSWNLMGRCGLGFGFGSVLLKGGVSVGLFPQELGKDPAFDLQHLTTTSVSLLVPLFKGTEWYYVKQKAN